MSVFEQTIKRLAKIAPEMKFTDVIKIAEEYQQNSNDHSEKNFVVLLLLEMIGVDGNGNWPQEFKDKATTNDKFAFAMKHAGICHGGHSCGIPGYEASMNDYYQKFIRGHFQIEIGIKDFQKSLQPEKW